MKDFWITNISNMNVGLSDLNITIKAYSSINLLDNKHYNFTLEELKISLEKGSLYKKRKYIRLRKNEPKMLKANTPLLSETYLPSRERSIINTKQEKYDELLVSDEDFANDNADLI